MTDNATVAKSIRTNLMLVTPKMATEWLDMNNNNRKLSPGTAERYADDMRNGRWKLTHQGIAFNCDGTLLDGQHRLRAVVLSGCQQRMMVTFGLPVESVSVVDDHRKRTAADALQIVHGVRSISIHKAVAIAQYMMVPGGNVTATYRSRQAQIDAYMKHQEAITWAMERMNTGTRGLCRAPLAAVIARAYYTQDHVRLDYFCKVLLDPSLSSDIQVDRAIQKLHTFMLTSPSSGGSGLSETYRKAEYALKSWLTGKVVNKLIEVSEEQFPTPDEQSE